MRGAGYRCEDCERWTAFDYAFNHEAGLPLCPHCGGYTVFEDAPRQEEPRESDSTGFLGCLLYALGFWLLASLLVKACGSCV